MKRKLRIAFIAAFLVTAPLLMPAQQPPHPNGGNAPTPGNNGPVGGGAPVGSGIIILLALGVVYGAANLIRFRNDGTSKELQN